MWRPLVSVVTTLLCCDYFSPLSVVSRAFSALCVYFKFRHHPHPLGYLRAKFCFFRSLHCSASPWRKITYSITHSPSLFDASGTEALKLRNSTKFPIFLITASLVRRQTDLLSVLSNSGQVGLHVAKLLFKLCDLKTEVFFVRDLLGNLLRSELSQLLNRLVKFYLM